MAVIQILANHCNLDRVQMAAWTFLTEHLKHLSYLRILSYLVQLSCIILENAFLIWFSQKNF